MRWLFPFVLLFGLAQAEPLKLTVDEALHIARERNPELAAAQAGVRSQEAIYRQAGSWPAGVLSAGVSRGSGQAATNGFSGLSRDEYVQFQQNLPPLGSLSKVQRAEQLALQEKLALARAARVSVERRTKDAFYTLLIGQERLSVLQANHDLAEQILQLTEKRVKLRKSTRLEAMAALVQRNEARLAQVQARGSLIQAEAELAPLLGMDPGTDLEAVGSTRFERAIPELERLLALGDRAPKLEAARNSRDAAYQQVEASAAQGRITPGVSAIYDLRVPSYVVLATLSIPLDWGSLGYDVESKREVAHGEDAQVQAAQLDMGRGIRSAYANYRATALSSSTYLTDVLSMQEEAVSLNRAEFARNAVDYDQVLLAQQQLETMRGNYLDLLLAQWLALNALEEAVGAPLEAVDSHSETATPGAKSSTAPDRP